MPCNDISEVIDLRIDDADRLQSYRLNKRTCGAEIGSDSLLLSLFKDRSTAEILLLDGADVVDHFEEISEDDEFLYFKHLVAVQEAVRVLTGAASGAPTEPCTTASIGADADGIHFVGHIAVEMLAGKIKACGNCGSCSRS